MAEKCSHAAVSVWSRMTPDQRFQVGFPECEPTNLTAFLLESLSPASAPELRQSSCQLVCALCASSTRFTEELVDAGVLPTLLTLVTDTAAPSVVPAASALANVSF